MRIGRNAFDSYIEAARAREEFPECAACGGVLKIQCIQGEWLTICVRHPAHRGIRTSAVSA